MTSDASKLNALASIGGTLQYRVTDDVWSSSEPGIAVTYPTVKSNAAGTAGADYAIPAVTTSTVVGLSSPTNIVKEYYNTQAGPQVLYTWPHLMENGILPELVHHAAVGGQKLPYALSYHSHGSWRHIAVRVGGQGGDQSEKAMHRGLAETIHLYTYAPVNDPLLSATKKLSCGFFHCFDGAAALNFVNEAPASPHGIQLEQSFSWIHTVVGATTRGKKVVDAVRSVFDCLAGSVQRHHAMCRRSGS